MDKSDDCCYVQQVTEEERKKGVAAVRKALEAVEQNRTVANIRAIFETITEYEFLLANSRFGQTVQKKLQELRQDAEGDGSIAPSLQDQRPELVELIREYEERFKLPRRFRDAPIAATPTEPTPVLPVKETSQNASLVRRLDFT